MNRNWLNCVSLAPCLWVLGCGAEAPAPSKTDEPTIESIGTVSEPLWTGRRFGTECQQEYQNSWLGPVYEAWDRCGGFDSKMGATDNRAFYYNLSGGRNYYWHDSGDQYEIDTVDLFFVNTHGGVDTVNSNANWAMWEAWTNAELQYLRLGDESTGMKIFTHWACHTLYYADGGIWNRWWKAMSGGLLMSLGSHDVVYNGPTTDEVGEDFASDIQSGMTIKSAWNDVANDWAVDNDITVLATGTNQANCTTRRDTTKWTTTLPAPLRDGQIGYYCYSAWTDL
jgi:hypothetical protein